MKKTILYIDNNLTGWHSFQNVLQQMYHIFMAKSGEEGLQVLARESIQLVLTSHNLPEMTGPELIKQAKSKYPDVAYILQTDSANLKMANADKTRIDGFRTIIKPDTVEDLLLYIDQELENNQYILDLRNKYLSLEGSFYQIINTTIDGVLSVDSTQNIVMTNPAIEKMFGYTKQEMAGLSLNDLIPEAKRYNHQKHIKQFKKSKVSSKMMGANYTIKGIRANGHEFPIETSISKMEIGGNFFFNAIVRDISEKVKIVNELQQSEEKFKTFTESSQLPILVAQMDQIVYINKAGQNLFEYSKEEIFKMKFKQLIHPEFREVTLHRYKNRLVGAKVSPKNILKVLSKSGKVYDVESSASKIELSRKPAVLVSLMDITDIKKAELKIKRLNEELEERVRERTFELEKGNAEIIKVEKELRKVYENEKKLGDLKSRFVSVASHQFRTPLTVIQSNTDILKLKIEKLNLGTDTNFIIATNRILDEVSRMKDIMDDVLILGKINANRITLHPEQTDVLGLCKITISRFNNLKDERSVHFETSGSPADIWLDTNLMHQAVSNLLSNAFKYSTGDVLLVVSFKKKTALIEITDFGIGIPAEEIKNLFQPFYRARNVLKIPGTGLGLSITKEYVELNNGTIEVRSEIDKKTTFSIVLPLM